MKTFNPLRILARSTRWQILYNRSKEVGSLKLFNNDADLTPLQLSFLQWLEIYSSLEMDLAMKEKNISREVIEDEYRTDAYLYVRGTKNTNEEKKGPPEGYEPTDVPSVIFKRGH
jgi:hypothetical protein